MAFKPLPSLGITVGLERSPRTLWSPVLAPDPRGRYFTKSLDFWLNRQPGTGPLAATFVRLCQPRCVPLFAHLDEGTGSTFIADDSVFGIWVINGLTRFFLFFNKAVDLTVLCVCKQK